MERIGDWMQTYTGAQFWPLDPRTEEIRFDDIAAALSKMCRYGGHCIKFYSVAEHCVHIASKAPDELKLQALMHDAAEGYLVDVPRPLKYYLSEYRHIEHRLTSMIFKHFKIDYPISPEIKRLDQAIIEDEREQNMSAPPVPWNKHGGPLGVTLKFWTPAHASYEFTTAFYRYGGRP